MASEPVLNAFTAIANGKLGKAWMNNQLAMGYGCAYQGTTVCHYCPWAERIARMCEYRCHRCPDRHCCQCGQKGQERLVEAVLGEALILREVGENGSGNGQNGK